LPNIYFFPPFFLSEAYEPHSKSDELYKSRASFALPAGGEEFAIVTFPDEALPWLDAGDKYGPAL
jgi:hypothetical protein